MVEKKENEEEKFKEDKEKSSKKKKNTQEDNEVEEKKQVKKVERQLIKVLAFFVFLVALFFVASWIFEELSKIEYQGLTFTKEKFGELIFYHYYYYFEGNDGQINRYNLYLRNDPRVNEVPVYADSPIIFHGALGASPFAMITLDIPSELSDCRESFAAIGTLAGFLGDNNINVKSGIMNETEAGIQNRTYATCQNQANTLNMKVIQIVSGNETRIDIEGSCHTITIGPNCEAIKAVEKYITQSIIDARTNP